MTPFCDGIAAEVDKTDSGEDRKRYSGPYKKYAIYRKIRSKED
jgi:hypothetical protein